VSAVPTDKNGEGRHDTVTQLRGEARQRLAESALIATAALEDNEFGGFEGAIGHFHRTLRAARAARGVGSEAAP